MLLPRNFSWLVPGELAGCACPSSEAELRALVAAGVHHLITLSAADTPPPPCVVSLPGLTWTAVDVPEFRGPSSDDFQQLFKLYAAAGGEGVAVHCRMGRGRTGTVLAAFLMHNEGLTAREAMSRVRRARPGSVETRHQEEALEQLETLLRQKCS
jgi:atypical dual specificity phosphatase